MKKTEKAYLAGFIDGDGSIYCVFRSDGHIDPMVTFTNNSKDLLDELEQIVGEEKVVSWGRSRNAEHQKDTYAFRIQRQDAISELLGEILPYLKRKKPQAELMLEYVESRARKRTEYTEKEKKIAHKIKELNKKGVRD